MIFVFRNAGIGFIVLWLFMVATGCSTTRSLGPGAAKAKETRVSKHLPLIPEAYRYFTTANYLSAAGHDSEAVVMYRRALTHDHASRAIRIALARSYFRLRRYDESAIQAESLMPRDKEVFQLLSEIYSRVRNSSRLLAISEEWSRYDSTEVRVWQYLNKVYFSLRDTTNQMRALEALCRLKPSPLFREQLAFLMLGQGNHAGAEQHFHRALASDSSQKSSKTLLGLAQIWIEREHADSAYYYYRSAVDLNFYNTDLRRRFIYFLIQNRKSEEAITEARLLLSLSAEPQLEILYRLAVLEYASNQLDSAEAHMTRWVTEGGDDGFGRYMLGRIAMEKGDTVTAEAQYLASLAIADSLWEPRIGLGFLYSSADRFDAAIAIYQQGLRIHPKQPNLLFNLGAVFERAGRFDESVASFKQLIAVDPDHAPALNYLGYMWADRGTRLKDALKMIERALEIQPNNGAYLDSYAWVLFRMGRTIAAARKLEEALNYIQEDAIVFEHYGDILAGLGRAKEAILNWERALIIDPDNIQLKVKLKR